MTNYELYCIYWVVGEQPTVSVDLSTTTSTKSGGKTASVTSSSNCKLRLFCAVEQMINTNPWSPLQFYSEKLSKLLLFTADFELLMKKNGKEPKVLPSKNRAQCGHEKTREAICLICYEEYKLNPLKKYHFSRFNPSTMKIHMKCHKDICPKYYASYFVKDDDQKAVRATKEYIRSCST